MEKKEYFSIRKFKNGVGSKLLGYAFKGGLMLTLIAPTVLNSAVALAEGSSGTGTSSSAVVTQPETTPEVADESTGTQQDLANAQNLKEAKPEETEAKKAQLAEAGKTSGHIDHYESSAVLDKAVEAAKVSGVTVTTTGETKVYNSAKEALADYETQAKTIAEVVTKYETMKKAHAEATKKYQDYTKSKGAYDAEKAKYDQDVTKYKADKAKYDEYLKLKADYEKALDAYNKAYAQYEKDLAAYQAAVKANAELVAKYEKEKATFDKAYTLYQDELKKAKAIEDENAEKQKVYDTALAAYNVSQKSYETALAAYNTTVANNKKLQADYDAAMKKYETDLATYKTKKAAYDKEKAAYDKAVAEATANMGKDGYLSRLAAQNLIYVSEPNARFELITKSAKEVNKFSEDFWVKAFDGLGFSAANSDDAYVKIAGGQSVSARWTNLSNSHYIDAAGVKHKISAVDYVFKNKTSEDAHAALLADPADTIFFTAGDGKDEFTLGIDYTFTLENGRKVTFSKDAPALASGSSLNRETAAAGTDKNLEAVRFNNGDLIPIVGSTIEDQGGGLAYSSIVNDKAQNPEARFTTKEWDNSLSPNAFYGAIAAEVVSGDTISIDSVSYNRAHIWLRANADVKASGLLPNKPTAPVEPAKPTPPAIKDPEKPTAPTKPTLALKEVPKVTPPVEPAKPAITTPTEPGKPTAPTPPSEVPVPSDPGTPPSEPTPVPNPPALEKLSVEIHTNKWISTPPATKAVNNAAGDNLDGQLIPKGQVVTFTLGQQELAANREEITTANWSDYLPQGFELGLDPDASAEAKAAAVQAENPAYTVIYDAKEHHLSLDISDETKAAINTDRSKAYTLPAVKITGIVTNDGATYENVGTLTINGDYVTNTKKVTVKTPGKPVDPNNPEEPGQSFIRPIKDVIDETGQSINDKDLVVGSKATYKIKYDMNQHKGIIGDNLTFAIGDDFDGKSVKVDLETVQLVDEQGQAYEGITPAIYASMDAAPAEVQAKYANQDYQFDGDFLDVAINDPQDFYENVVKPGRDLHLTFDFEVIKGAGKDIKNTAVQVDFGNVYATNTVINHPLLTTEWVEVDKNGGEVKVLKDKFTGEATQEAGEFDQLKFVKTVETPTGIKHQFIQLYTTEWETEDGKKVLKDKVTDDHTLEKEEFGGYKFVKTIETKTGLKHLYTRTTEWVDEDGKPLKNLVENPELQDKGSFDGYEFVKTIETPTGIKHIFKKKAEPKKEEKKETPASSTSTPAQPTPAVQRTVSTPQTVTETRLPSTGEIVGYGSVLGLGLLGGIVAWKSGLFKKIKARFSK